MLALATPAIGQDANHPQEPPAQDREVSEADQDQPIAETPPTAASIPTTKPNGDDDHAGKQQTEANNEHGQGFFVGDAYVRLDDTLTQWVIAVSSIFAVAISALAVILLMRTLKATRDAITEAENATKAAEGTTAVTRESAEHQLRAYVYVLDSGRTRRGEGDPWAIQTRIQNFGQTPAYNVRVAIAKRFVETEKVENLEFPEAPYVREKFDLPPGGQYTVRMGIPELSNQLWDDFKAFRTSLFVWGRIDFVDAFQQQRWIRFRYFQDGGYVRNLMTCPEGNDSSEHPDN